MFQVILSAGFLLKKPLYLYTLLYRKYIVQGRQPNTEENKMINPNLLNIHKGNDFDTVELNYAKIGIGLNQADIDYILNDLLINYRQLGRYMGAKRVRNFILLLRW